MLDHFFLSSTESRPAPGGFLLVRPQPAVMLPSRLNARITIGEFGTLFGLADTQHNDWHGNMLRQQSGANEFAYTSRNQHICLERSFSELYVRDTELSIIIEIIEMKHFEI